MGRTRIGLEVHVELDTESKLFCSCPRKGTDEPNVNVCPVCTGKPGSKPWVNRKAVEYAIMVCKALRCEVSPLLKFSRKSYFYPDLPKNFQITQYEEPIGKGGWLEVNGKRILLRRIHLEEDPAGISYPSSPKESRYSLIDHNRSGSPLIEIVTEPWDGEAEDAKFFLRRLMNLLEYIGVFDPGTCIIKSDVNVSIEESGFKRVEIKNITGFREVEKAINYEVLRQKNALRFGQEIHQETRGWDPASGTTYLLRRKEEEEDYGYIPEPNIPAVDISGIDVVLPELPWEREKRFIEEYGLAEDDARVITSSFRLSEMFENLAKKFPGKGRDIGHWVRKEVLKVLNYRKADIEDFPVSRLEKILEWLLGGRISDSYAKFLMKTIFEEEPKLPEAGDMREAVRQALSRAGQAVEDYKNGEAKALDYIVGLVMREHPEFDAREVRKAILDEIEKAG